MSTKQPPKNPVAPDILERLLDGEDPEAIRPGLFEELNSTAEGLELLDDLGLLSDLEDAGGQTRQFTGAQLQRSWSRFAVRALGNRRERTHGSPAARLLATLAFLGDVITPGRAFLLREPPDVSEELLRRGYPMTGAQRSALAEILEARGVFESWRHRRQVVRAARRSLALCAIIALIAVGISTLGPNDSQSSQGVIAPTVAYEVLNGSIDASGDFLETPSTSTAYVAVADHTRIAMAKSSLFKLVSERRAELKTGSVWLDVEKGGSGFQVETEFGTVIVTGTSFGVTRTPDGALFEVSEGSVIIRRNGTDRVLSAGESLAGEAEGLAAAVVKRALDTAKPDWAMDAPFFVGDPIRINCEAVRLLGNWHMRSAGDGLVLHRLSRPITGKARFQLRYMKTTEFDYKTNEEDYLNAFLALGDSPDNGDLLKCGTFIGVASHSIFEGPWRDGGNFERLANVKRPMDPRKPFNVTVDVDLTQRTLLMVVNGERIEANLPDHLERIEYVGYYCYGTSSAFSPIHIQSLP